MKMDKCECVWYNIILRFGVGLTRDLRTGNQCVASPCACGGRLYVGTPGRTSRTRTVCIRCASGCA